MKRIITGLLTIFLTMFILAFGVSLNLKSTIIDTMDEAIKNEVIKNIIDVAADDIGIDKEKAKTELDKALEKNDDIKNIMSTYYDKFINVILDKEQVGDINISKEIDNLLDVGETILKDQGIELTEEMKSELKSVVSSTEVNKVFNETIEEVKQDLPQEIKTSVKIYDFITSTSFRFILIGLILLAIVLIALLKKSIYKWLSNVSTACIINGIMLGIAMPSLVDWIIRELATEENIVIATGAFERFGIITLAIGVVAIIGNVILTKALDKEMVSE